MVGGLRHLYPFSLLGKSEADKDNAKSTLSALRLSALRLPEAQSNIWRVTEPRSQALVTSLS